MKIIKEIEFNSRENEIKIELLRGDGVRFTVIDDENEKITDIVELKAIHEQDCCEHVYADFSILCYYKRKRSFDRNYKKLIIKEVPKAGLLLIFVRDRFFQRKIFIPCYNEQNGYYSSDLTLQIKHNDKVEEIDISKSTQDLID